MAQTGQTFGTHASAPGRPAVQAFQSFANVAAFPTTGAAGIGYIDQSTDPDSLYYWDGSAYQPIGGGGGSPFLFFGSKTLFPAIGEAGFIYVDEFVSPSAQYYWDTASGTYLPLSGGMEVYNGTATFPATGVSGVTYVDMTTAPANPYYWNGTAYVPVGYTNDIVTTSLIPQVYKAGAFTSAQADAPINVADIFLLSDGTRMESGRIKYNGHGFTPGSYYFLSQTTAGAITATEPTSGWLQRVMFVEDADTIHLQVEPAVNLSNTSPTVSRYVGGTAGDPTVTIGNFEIRYQSSSSNLQIRTISGTETINFYSEAWFSSGSNASTSGKNIAVTTTFANFTDPGVLFDAENRTVRFTPIATADQRFYQLIYNGWDNGATDKILLRLEAL